MMMIIEQLALCEQLFVCKLYPPSSSLKRIQLIHTESQQTKKNDYFNQIMTIIYNWAWVSLAWFFSHTNQTRGQKENYHPYHSIFLKEKNIANSNKKSLRSKFAELYICLRANNSKQTMFQ